ncbi:MAG TPA: glycosyltransferase family 39 protein [Bryobacteraceae bacterium]|nr:glycosyltransferase family 39 protein [Bryobacteraceae bacterium]
MNVRWQRWLPPALAAAVFALFSLALLPLPGFEDDEVFFSYPIYKGAGIAANLHLFGHTIPLMDVSYYGALKTWLYSVIFSLWPPTRWSVRLPVVILGIATIWLTWEWVRKIAGPRAAAFTVALLSTDSMFILTNTFDWGPVAIQHLLFVGGLLALQLWLKDRGARWVALAFFLWGLGLWDKALMVWNLGGLAVAAVCVYPRESWPALRSKAAGIAAVALVAGALPLIAYNIARHGDTAVSNTRLSLSSVPHKVPELRAVLRGEALFGVIAANAPGPIQQQATALPDQAGSYRTRPFLFALALSAIAWCFLIRRREGRILAFLAVASAVAWLQMAANSSTGGSAHHVILLWPFPWAIAGIALAGASERVPKYGRWAIAALVTWFTVANILNTNTYLRNLTRNGAPTAWTDASERLAGAISHYRDDPIVTVDWGYITVLRMFYGGDLQLIAINGATADQIAAVVPRPNAIFIQHTDNNQIVPGVNERLRAIAAGIGYSEESLRIVHDDEGRPVFEIFRLTKARQFAR